MAFYSLLPSMNVLIACAFDLLCSAPSYADLEVFFVCERKSIIGAKIPNRKSKNPGRFDLEGLRQPRGDLRGRNVLGFYSSCCIFLLI